MRPSRKVLILEIVSNASAYDGFNYSHGLKVGEHHNGNNNILWADMHVAPMKKTDLEWFDPSLIDPFTWLYPYTD